MSLNVEECAKITELAGTDGALIVTEPNRIYLTGYASTQAAIAVRADGVYYFTDKRYLSEAREKIGGGFIVREGGAGEAAAMLASCRRVGVEFDLPHGMFRQLSEKMKKTGLFSAHVRDITPVLSKIRSVKKQSETDSMRKAQEVTDRAFSLILPYIREGVTEIELAARLEYIMQKQGATLAFDTIMAFGENSAVPHAHRSERALCRGDMIVMDMGARVNGYCSDMTRTVAFGEISSRRADIYEKVLTANKNAIAELKAGVIGADVQESVKKYFASCGIEKNFTHSLGHGVGIDIHEAPYYNREPLAAGQVITVEPGVYFDGDFGIRIEDMVKITQDGVENLTKSDKSLIIVGK